MTREDLIKHWDVLKAFKNGHEIQVRSGEGYKWKNIENAALFSEDYEYRVKPTFVPKNGDRVMVSDDKREWLIRVFICMHGNSYICLEGDEENIVMLGYDSHNVNAIMWKHCKPIREL